ncbi:Uncharacterised protein [Salmonella enterica subsp. enterica serovar Typhimurium str. DT104]|nr:Uncharacterised protein [Salmonella enterica subsp. enterica serovar Typhimurium str. DT104]
MHGSGKLAADALTILGGAERQRLALGHLRTGARNFPLAQGGEKIAPVEDSAVPVARGVALFDMMLAALVHGFADLLPEAGRRKVGRFAMDQSPVHPRIEDEPVGSDPAPSQGGNPRLEEPHNLVERVFGSKVTGAGGDAIPLR